MERDEEGAELQMEKKTVQVSVSYLALASKKKIFVNEYEGIKSTNVKIQINSW